MKFKKKKKIVEQKKKEKNFGFGKKNFGSDTDTRDIHIECSKQFK